MHKLWNRYHGHESKHSLCPCVIHLFLSVLLSAGSDWSSCCHNNLHFLECYIKWSIRHVFFISAVISFSVGIWDSSMRLCVVQWSFGMRFHCVSVLNFSLICIWAGQSFYWFFWLLTVKTILWTYLCGNTHVGGNIPRLGMAQLCGQSI